MYDCDQEVAYENRIVAFIDILGWTSAVCGKTNRGP